MPKIRINHDSNLWPAIDKTVRRAVKATLAECSRTKKVEVGILLTEDGRVRHLNHHYRQQDRATNVLSFAMCDGETAPHTKKNGRLLGDVVLAYQTVAQEAASGHMPLEQHLTHLVVHGVLHLLGYDHERSPAEARRQESQEIAILAELGLPNPYRERPCSTTTE